MNEDKLKEMLKRFSSNPDQFKKFRTSIEIADKNKEKIRAMVVATLDQFINLKEKMGEDFPLSVFFEAILTMAFAEGYKQAQEEILPKKDDPKLN
jgi:hypothetical protein